MKNGKKENIRFVKVILLIIFFVCLSKVSFAKSLDNGVEIDIQTEKEAYAVEDEVNTTILVTNQNEFDIYDLNIDAIIPNGLSVKDGSVSNKTVKELKAGESTTLELILVNNNTSNSIIPKTGDKSMYIVGGLATILIIMFVCVYRKNKKIGRMFIFIFTIGVFFISSNKQFAQTISKSIQTSKVITMGKTQYKLEAKLIYNMAINNEDKDEKPKDEAGEDTTKSFEEKEVEKLSDVDWDYNEIDFTNLKWLKTEDCGNICIPSNWESDEDVETLSLSEIVYESEDVSESIVVKDCSADFASIEIEALLQKLSVDNDVEEWSYESAKIGEKNAVIINVKFGKLEHIQSTLFIASPDNSRMIIVGVEAPDPNVRKLLNTFTFEDHDEDAVSYFNSVNE